jgi:hypothetical protein
MRGLPERVTVLPKVLRDILQPRERTCCDCGASFPAALGAGTVYGSRVYTAADGANSPANPAGTNQSITLDPAGIAAILSNTTFGIGGRVTTLGGSPTNEFIFDSSGTGVCPTCIAQLQITTQAAVPQPETYGLLAAGFAALLVLRRRAGRRSQASG